MALGGNQLNSSWMDRIFYDALGHTGNSYYVRFVFRGDSSIWDDVAESLKNSPTWVNTAVDLVEDGTTGQFPVIVPGGLPQGVYDVVVYKKAGSVAANTDDVESTYILKNGSVMGF